MGKTPLLPVYAAALGASELYIGLIAGISTLTGIAFKPIAGLLSDRWGRHIWLWAGFALFAGIPFLYALVAHPDQLVALRLVHGLATAVWGPVTVAFVVDHAGARRAEHLGWFGLARAGGYVVGPALGGWLLEVSAPVAVYRLSGVIAALALVPMLLMGRGPAARAASKDLGALGHQLLVAFRSGARTATLWLGAALDSVVFVALYAVRTFLPLYALSTGTRVALVGIFFSVQQLADLVARPPLGRVADRVGYRRAIVAGLGVLAAAIFSLSRSPGSGGLLVLATLTGAGQALVFPATVALVAQRIDSRYVGTGMGMLGSLKNTGKVLGPVVGGLLVQLLDFEWMVRAMSALLVLAATAVWVLTGSRRRSAAPTA